MILEQMGKNIVICCDGTFQDRNGLLVPSNAVKLASAIANKSSSGEAQVVFYSSGLGTNNVLSRLFGGAFGLGRERILKDVYGFIANNYSDGDRLFFFGCGSGAWTVRIIAAMVAAIGVLSVDHLHKFSEAYDLYRERSAQGSHKIVKKFDQYTSKVNKIEFMGVWDSVGPLGISGGSFQKYFNKKYQFHDLDPVTIVSRICHALAIDEFRRVFKPALWKVNKDSPNQHIEQVWFAGCHADVAGGYRDSGLSDISLMWMIENAQRSGLNFDENYLKKAVQQNTRGRLHDSRIGLFKFLSKYLRPIGVGSPLTESIHPSVLARMKANQNYKPNNVLFFQAAKEAEENKKGIVDDNIRDIIHKLQEHARKDGIDPLEILEGATARAAKERRK